MNASKKQFSCADPSKSRKTQEKLNRIRQEEESKLKFDSYKAKPLKKEIMVRMRAHLKSAFHTESILHLGPQVCFVICVLQCVSVSHQPASHISHQPASHISHQPASHISHQPASHICGISSLKGNRDILKLKGNCMHIPHNVPLIRMKGNCMHIPHNVPLIRKPRTKWGGSISISCCTRSFKCPLFDSERLEKTYGK